MKPRTDALQHEGTSASGMREKRGSRETHFHELSRVFTQLSNPFFRSPKGLAVARLFSFRGICETRSRWEDSPDLQRRCRSQSAIRGDEGE